MNPVWVNDSLLSALHGFQNKISVAADRLIYRIGKSKKNNPQGVLSSKREQLSHFLYGHKFDVWNWEPYPKKHSSNQ